MSSISSFSVAASAIQAGQLRLGNAAHNIANLNTEGATRLRTEQSALEGGGVHAETRTTPQTIDLAEEIIGLREAETQVGLASKFFQVVQETEGRLVDELA